MGANAVGSKLDRLKIIAFALELKVKAAGWEQVYGQRMSESGHE